MHCFADAPDLVTDVQWYFVDEQTRVIEFPTVFRSRLYERELLQLPLGEEIDFHPYSPGAAPVDVDGVLFCGTPAQWLNGSATTDPVSPINPMTGVQVCCGPAGFFTAGGAVVNGLSVVGVGPLFSFNNAVVVGGDFSRTLIQPVTPGGVVAGGTVDLTGGVFPVDGGAAVGGTVGFSAGGQLTLSGGAAAGGTIGFNAGDVVSMAGGAAAGGTIGFNAGDVVSIIGGSADGGEIGFKPGDLFSPAGGSSVGGSPGFVFSEVFSIAGGAAVGGTIGFLAGGSFSVRGGSAAGGVVGFLAGAVVGIGGGSAVGGTIGFVASGTFSVGGGSAAGGDSDLLLGLIADVDGGSTTGGTVTKVEGVFTDCCPGPLAVNLVLRISNKTGGCTCMPDEIPVTWNGILWRGEDVSNTCGVDTTLFTVECQAFPFDVFVLCDPEVCVNMTMVSCEPLKWTVTMNPFSYCFGSYDVSFEEP